MNLYLLTRPLMQYLINHGRIRMNNSTRANELSSQFCCKILGCSRQHTIPTHDEITYLELNVPSTRLYYLPCRAIALSRCFTKSYNTRSFIRLIYFSGSFGCIGAGFTKCLRINFRGLGFRPKFRNVGDTLVAECLTLFRVNLNSLKWRSQSL